MARVNVYLPDQLAEAVRAGGVNLSNVTQVAVERELVRRNTSSWLRRVAFQRRPGLTHAAIVKASVASGDTPMTPLVGTVGARGPRHRSTHVVLHASAVLDLMLSADLGLVVESALAGCVLHSPAHLDREVLAALAALDEAGLLGAHVAEHVETLRAAPIERHPLPELIVGAWERRHHIDLDPAFYVALAAQLDAALVATDPGLAAVPVVGCATGASSGSGADPAPDAAIGARAG